MSTIYLGGWGRSTWGFGSWNEASTLPALGGSVGSVTTVVRINALGVSGTGQVGEATQQDLQQRLFRVLVVLLN